MENTILLTSHDLMIDILVAFLHMTVLLNVGYALVKSYKRKYTIGSVEVVVLLLSVCISTLFLTQTFIQFDRGGRSAIPRLWDVLNVLVVLVLLMTTNVITRYRNVNMGDDYPKTKKII